MRFICMEALLASKGWDIIDVQLLLDIPLIPRTSDGWLHREKKALGLAGSQRFSRVDGISFDLNTGEMQFHFQTSRNRDGTDAMFSSNDVTEVFQQGIPAAFFTLNEPDKDYHAHPFHQMLYSPPALVGTQYLATLLHTDYLLKMLTTGTEICAKAPFNMRSIADSCFQRLPKHLQDKLKPLHDREHNFSLGRTHRFWIEADPLVYEQQNSTSHITFRVANVHLRVRKHLLIRNANGQLVDDDEANETEEEQRSPESQFAKAFTEHYDEIGTYFPELLRLKELLKLSALYLFARGRCSQLAVPYKLQPFVNQLVENRRSIEYPHATQANIERDYSQILSTNNVQAHGVPHTEATRVKQGIRSQLEKIDREIVEMLVSSICKQAHTNVSSLPRSLVEHWLNNQYRATENLAQFVVNGLAAFHLTLMHPITKLKICLQDIGEQSASLRHFDDTCNWVPAAFCNKLGTGVRIYGGVNLQLKLVEGNVSGNNLTQTFNAATVINSQSNDSARGKEQKEAATREWEAKVNAGRKRETASGGSRRGGSSDNSGRNVDGGGGGGGGYIGDDEPTSSDRRDADGVPSWYSGTTEEYYRERKQASDAQRRLKTGEFRTIDRIDTRPEIMWEVEFKDGSSLQKNGRWKHGGRPISNKEEAFLQQYGWVLPAK
ncbi:unnamed protein product [Adineta steineri]|uniref:Uncharacterized protein n=1 Tax=Adineta steineri TaxID=433720 RepID=A0A814XDM3_9BILA|nr:unnamed protein product [Adineta steineri]CAF1213559.1 unnamed protein product [Adineta steineri]